MKANNECTCRLCNSEVIMSSKSKAFEYKIGDRVRVTGIIKIEYNNESRGMLNHKIERFVCTDNCEPFNAVVTGYTFRFGGILHSGHAMLDDRDHGYLEVRTSHKVVLVKASMRCKEIAVPLHGIELIKQIWE